LWVSAAEDFSIHSGVHVNVHARRPFWRIFRRFCAFRALLSWVPPRCNNSYR